MRRTTMVASPKASWSLAVPAATTKPIKEPVAGTASLAEMKKLVADRLQDVTAHIYPTTQPPKISEGRREFLERILSSGVYRVDSVLEQMTSAKRPDFLLSRRLRQFLNVCERDLFLPKKVRFTSALQLMPGILHDALGMSRSLQKFVTENAGGVLEVVDDDFLTAPRKRQCEEYIGHRLHYSSVDGFSPREVLVQQPVTHINKGELNCFAAACTVLAQNRKPPTSFSPLSQFKARTVASSSKNALYQELFFGRSDPFSQSLMSANNAATSACTPSRKVALLANLPRNMLVVAKDQLPLVTASLDALRSIGAMDHYDYRTQPEQWDGHVRHHATRVIAVLEAALEEPDIGDIVMDPFMWGVILRRGARPPA